MFISCSPTSNLVIDSLPHDVRRRWAVQLEKVRLPERLVLYESGDTLGFAYFPTTAVVSIVYVTDEGKSTELAAIGNEGMVGIELLLGGWPHAQPGLGGEPRRGPPVACGAAARPTDKLPSRSGCGVKVCRKKR